MLQKFKIVIAIFGINLLWTFIIPGFAAYHDGAFYAKDIPNKITNPRQRALVIEHLNRQSQLDKAIDSLEAVIIKNSEGAKAATLFIQRSNLEKIKESTKNSLRLSGFCGAHINYMFFLVFLSLSILIAYNYRNEKRNWKSVFILCLCLHLLFDWTNVLRNFIFNVEYRTIFSFANSDISLASWILQDLRVLSIFFTLALLIEQWNREIKVKLHELSGERKASLVAVAMTAQRSFARWQFNTIVLAGVFIPFSWQYWGSIFTYHDSRYVYASIMIHTIWAFCWLVITYDFYLSVRSWNQFKLGVIQADFEEAKTSRLELLEAANPFTSFQVITGFVLSVVGFAIPFINALLK